MIADLEQSPPVFTEDSPFDISDLSDLKAFEFKDPAELLLFVYPHLNPHKWQIEELQRIAKPYSKENPYLYVLCACNSSGKDSYIVAGTVLWLTVSKLRHRTILTSSSGTQLTTQTEQYIADICGAFNARIGFECLKIRQRRIRCYTTGSEIILFATDEAGKAEGFHPYPDYPGAEMCIVVNEAKSVAEIIFKALARCEGYSRWIEVSTPGAMAGHFYDIASIAKQYPEDPEEGKWYCRVITAYDCPHITKAHINNMALLYREDSDLYKSSILAQFTSSDQQVVITYENLRKCRNSGCKKVSFGSKRAGLDIAAGGDEHVLSVWWGNTQLAEECFKEKDSVKATNYIIKLFLKWDLHAEHVWADDGGVGRSTIDQLWDRGWKVNRILNQWSAINKREYSNRGSEMWFRVARFIQECVVVLLSDPKLDKQLTTRFYKRSDTTGKILLESKADAKLAGRSSPDRADAMVLAFTGQDIGEYLKMVGRHGYKVGDREYSMPENDRQMNITTWGLPSQEVLTDLMKQRNSPTENLRSFAGYGHILDEYYQDIKL
jgi:phage terminase large subunit